MSSKHSKKSFVSQSTILTFLTKVAGMNIDSDEKLEVKDPNFILECYYISCFKLGLCDKTLLGQKVFRKTGESVTKANTSTIMQFSIVRSILNDVFNIQYGLNDFFEPKQILMKEIFGAFIHFKAHVDEIEKNNEGDLNKITVLEN